MMLEIKKKQVELMRVECAKAEMQMKILEMQDNIKRLETNITIQDKRIEELNTEINNLKKG